jgi:hypothetical protein
MALMEEVLRVHHTTLRSLLDKQATATRALQRGTPSSWPSTPPQMPWPTPWRPSSTCWLPTGPRSFLPISKKQDTSRLRCKLLGSF